MAHDAKILKLLEKIISQCTDIHKIKYGRDHRGYVATTPSGVKTLFILRKNQQLWRGGEWSQTLGILADKASWGIDADVLREWRRKGVTHVVIFVRDTADVYTSVIQDWFDSSKAKDQRTTGSSSSELRHLKLCHMHKKTLETHWTLR